MLRQATNPQTTPGLDQPAYTVLRRAGEYEVRRYAPYVVAEVGMPASAPPASGAPPMQQVSACRCMGPVHGRGPRVSSFMHERSVKERSASAAPASSAPSCTMRRAAAGQCVQGL